MTRLAGLALLFVACVRLDMAFSCADGTTVAIYDDPWRSGRIRVGAGIGDHGSLRGGGDGWWKDERAIHGPRGEVCLLHGNHVHCVGALTDVP
ncbi:MAG: hypothetical protein FJZ38_14625 [Candidatus Rokubacteria bacterium]|nr:hypothetical protein [Candidatus Rokubacteria bacterium]